MKTEKGSKKPNILWIVSDQHNPRIAGYEKRENCFTPNLDRLAAAGTKFDTAYCQAPVCTPSRVSMLAGKHGPNCSAWDSGSRLKPEHLSMAKHLSNNGYTTALVGKAHLHRPNWKGGFDHRPYGDLYVGPFCFHQPDPPESWDGKYNDHELGRFCFAGETKIPESMIADTVVTRESLSFLLEHQDKNPGKPWMLCAGYGRPHFPLTAPGRYIRRALANPPQVSPLPRGYPESLHPHDRYIAVEDFDLPRFSQEVQQHALACYYASLNYLDDCVGELLDGLEKAGLLDNTYIIYTTDHGEMATEHGLWWKRTYYDGSARVPLIIRGEGLSQGASVKTPVELVDLYPTFCEMAGIALPEGLDGESLLPLCKGQGEKRKKTIARTDFIVGPAEGGKAISFRMLRDERWKYVEFPEHRPRLFDMEKDPGELNDLFEEGKAESCGAPLDEFRKKLAVYGDWEALFQQLEAEGEWERTLKVEGGQLSPGQYQLSDGSIVEGDVGLYPGFRK